MTPGDAKPPPSAARSAPRSWLGLVAVALGATVMVGGIAGVWFYARHLPVAATTATPPSLPPVVSAVPAPPPPPEPKAEAAPLAPPEPAPAAPAPHPLLALPLAVPPYAEDANAPVPVLGGHPLWGSRDGFVTATIFADLESPPSIAVLRELLPLKVERGESLRLVFRSLPASDHREGERGARALAEIHATRGEQAFWHALAAIVRRGEPLEPGVLATVLGDAGLDGFPLPAPNADAEAELADDRALATLLFVRDTPTLFVNGQRLTGFAPQAALAELVDREVHAAYLTLASGLAPAAVYTERTKKNLLNLGSDPPGRSCVPPGKSPALGPADALVTIVEFSDLECELCRQGEAALAPVLRAHPRDVRVVWKNFPLPQHARARLAAAVALAARKLGGDAAFWAVTHALLEPRSTLDDATLAQAAARAGLDGAAVLESARSGSFDASIDGDLKLGEALGVSGAPTYFVNGQRVAGALPVTELQSLVQRELALARRVRAQGAGAVADLACDVFKRSRVQR